MNESVSSAYAASVDIGLGGFGQQGYARSAQCHVTASPEEVKRHSVRRDMTNDRAPARTPAVRPDAAVLTRRLRLAMTAPLPLARRRPCGRRAATQGCPHRGGTLPAPTLLPRLFSRVYLAARSGGSRPVAAASPANSLRSWTRTSSTSQQARGGSADASRGGRGRGGKPSQWRLEPASRAEQAFRSLHDPAERARVLWEHSRSLAQVGERSSAARYARDAPRAARLRGRPPPPRRVASRHGASCAWAQRRRRVAHHPRLRQLRRHRLVARLLRRRARPKRRRTPRWTPPGTRESRPSTLPTRYGGGRSESFIGSWLRGQGPRGARPDRPGDEDVQPDGRRRGPAASRASGSGARSTTSLTRLGVDAVPLYLAHAMDPNVTIGETIGTFEELVGRRRRSGA